MVSVKDIILVQSERHDVAYVLRICAVAALGGILFGYDTAVISGAIGPLQRHFALSPQETGWAVSNVVIGSIIGAFVSGGVAQLLGRRMALFICAVLFTVSAVGAALAEQFYAFVCFRMIGGLAVGTACTVSPMYMSEVSPKDMRGRALNMSQMAIVGGQVVVFIVNYLISQHATEGWLDTMGWRWMLASAVIPCVVFCGAIFLIPESPRWHVLRGREEEALKTLTRISNVQHATSLLEEIKASIDTDSKTTSARLGLTALDKGSVWIIFVGAMIAMLQQLTGVNVMMYYAPMVLRNITSSNSDALFQTIWIGVASISGTVIGAWLVDRKGRLPLIRYCSLGMAAGLLLASWALYTQAPGLLGLAGLLIFMVMFGMSWGPLAWVLVSEIFPNRIRSLGMSISFMFMWIINFAVTQLFPVISENQYLKDHFHGAFSMWLFAFFCLFGRWFILRFIPETKGVSLEKVESVMLQRVGQVTSEAG